MTYKLFEDLGATSVLFEEVANPEGAGTLWDGDGPQDGYHPGVFYVTSNWDRLAIRDDATGAITVISEDAHFFAVNREGFIFIQKIPTKYVDYKLIVYDDGTNDFVYPDLHSTIQVYDISNHKLIDVTDKAELTGVYPTKGDAPDFFDFDHIHYYVDRNAAPAVDDPNSNVDRHTVFYHVPSRRPLFDETPNKVNFNTLAEQRAVAGSANLYNALGGDDTVWLPNTTNIAGTVTWNPLHPFEGDAGIDTIVGGRLNDIIYGDNIFSLPGAIPGNDDLSGGRGKDQLFGGSGDDILDGGLGDGTGKDNDRIDGGPGVDTLSVPFTRTKLEELHYGFKVSYSDLLGTTATMAEQRTGDPNNLDIDTDLITTVEKVEYSGGEKTYLLGKWGELLKNMYGFPMPAENIKDINEGLVSPGNKFMKGLMGDPTTLEGAGLIKTMVAAPSDPKEFAIAGAGAVKGLEGAIVSLQAVLANVRAAHDDLADLLVSHGMFSRRNVANTKAFSNHYYGIAIDLRIGPLLDGLHDNYIMKGLAAIVPFFNDAGWYSGAAFQAKPDGTGGEDSMHFEVSKGTLGTWIDNKSALFGAGLGGEDTQYARESTTLGEGAKQNLVLVDGAGAISGTGNSADNILVGNKDKNTLDGSAGKDDLRGLAGNDTLIGGMGNDKLTGGKGNDRFVFDSKLSALNVDTVADFKSGEDFIVLSESIFKTIPVMSADVFATHQLIYNAGALSYDSNGAAAGGLVQFAQLSGAPTLTYLDFKLVP